MSSAYVPQGTYSHAQPATWMNLGHGISTSISPTTQPAVESARDTSSTYSNLATYLELSAAIEEASEPDWDGHGAAPVDRASLSCALKFIALLPAQFLRPDIEIDPQGDICFEWYAQKGSVLSICVSSNGTLYYAGIFSDMKTHGSTPMKESFPSMFIEFLKRVYGYA